ncbi:MAG: hypothetical protein ACOYJ2_08410, partial [Rickettsiales bacterium]
DKQRDFWAAQTNDFKSIKNSAHSGVFRKFLLATNKLSDATIDEVKAVSDGIDDVSYSETVDEAIRETESALEQIRSRINDVMNEDMFGHNDPDMPMLDYLDGGYAVIGEYLALIKERKLKAREDTEPLTPIEELPEFPSKSLAELSHSLQEQYPDTHDWLIASGWNVPSDITPRNDRTITPIAKMRHEIEVMANQLAGLNKFAQSVIYRPCEYVRELDAANEEWNKVRLRPAGQQAPQPPIDINVDQRRYDELLPSTNGTTSRYNGYNNLDEPLGKIFNLMPRTQGKSVTSAGTVTSSEDLGKDQYTNDEMMFAGALNAAETLAYDAKTAYHNAHNYIRKNSNPDLEVPDSELLPHSINCLQFCANEIYPRIFQQSLVLEKKVKELKHALAEQVGGGGGPVGNGHGAVVHVNFGGGRGK